MRWCRWALGGRGSGSRSVEKWGRFTRWVIGVGWAGEWSSVGRVGGLGC